MVTTRKILSNTFAQIVGKIGLSLLGFLSAKLVAVYLTLPERGHYEYVFNFLALAGTFADMGLYTIAIREYAKKEEPAEKILGNLLTIRNLLSIFVLIVAFLVIFMVPSLRERGPSFFLAVLLAGGAMMFSLLNGTITGVLQAEYKMKQASFSQVLGKIINIGLMALGMFALFPGNVYGGPVSFWGFQWLYVAALLGNISMYLYTRHHVKKIVPIRYQLDFTYCKKLFKEAFPYGLALTLGLFYFKIDVILLPWLITPKEIVDQQIAIYVGAVKILENFSIIPLFFLNALLPLILNLIKEENFDRLRHVVQSSFDLLFMMSMPIVVGMYTLAYPIIYLTNKGEYLTRSGGFLGSDIILQIVIFSVFFSYLNMLFNFLLVARGKQHKLILINGLTLLFNLVMNLIFVPRFGIIACAITTVICECFVLGSTYYFSKQGIDFQLKFTRVFRILIAALLMGALLLLSRDYMLHLWGSVIGLLLLVFEGAVVYGLGLVVLQVINKDLLRLLKRTEE